MDLAAPNELCKSKTGDEERTTLNWLAEIIWLVVWVAAGWLSVQTRRPLSCQSLWKWASYHWPLPRCGRLFGGRQQATTIGAPPFPPLHTLQPSTVSSTTPSPTGGTLISPSPTLRNTPRLTCILIQQRVTNADGRKWRCVNIFYFTQKPHLSLLAWQGAPPAVGKESLSSKSDLILWISSHCSTNSHREEWVSVQTNVNVNGSCVPGT